MSDNDKDNIVDGLDYLTWASNYPQGPNDGVAVPQPSSISLLGRASLLAMSCRRRKRT